MSRNILVSEWKAEIAKVAPLWLGIVRDDRIEWESVLGRTGCSVDLGRTEQRGAFAPEARVGSSGGLPVNAAQALVITLDTADTLRRCLSAHAMLAGLVVWFDEAPCDGCRGRGNTLRGDVCAACDGAKVRREVQP